MSKKVLVVDADTLIFRSCAATEEKSVIVKHLKSGRSKEYSHRTEFKNDMKAKSFEIKEGAFEIEDKVIAQPLSFSLNIINGYFNSLRDRFPDHELVVCAGDKNNFRLDLPLPKRYKANRDNLARPVNLKEAHKYVQKSYKSILADGYEADDLSCILAYEHLDKGNEVVLASPDKDSNSFDGITLFDYTNYEKAPVKVEEFNELYLNDKGDVKGYGVPWLCFQLVVGDATDNFKPSEIASKRFGAKSAYKLFKDCKSASECVTKAVEKYKEWYPEEVTYKAWDGEEYTKNWLELLQLYFSCARMKRSYDDDLDVKKFLGYYGVDYG